MEVRKSPMRRREAVPDPRFAAPEAPLVCTLNREKKAFRQNEEKAIGKYSTRQSGGFFQISQKEINKNTNEAEK